MADALRVVIADDHFLVRDGLRSLLESSREVEVVDAVGDGGALLASVQEHQPDAVLTDIRMPPGHATEGIDVAITIRERWPQIGVVVLSQHLEQRYVRALFGQGSEGLGYLLKERIGQRSDLIDALVRTSRGESVLDPRVVELMVGSTGADKLVALTDREREVLAHMATGLTNPAIAGAMFVSVSSVEKHIAAIFAKLNLGDESDVNRRVAAVLTWLER